MADGSTSTSTSQLSVEKENHANRPANSEDVPPLPYQTKPEASTEDGQDAEELTRMATSDFPHGIKLAVIIVALVLSVFLVALDMTIVATAIPRITDEFHSLNQVGWYGSAFFLTVGAFQSTWGKAYKYFHLKPSFLVAIGIFELGSLICGVAQDSTTLIIGRAIAGKSSSARFPASRLTVARYGWSRHRFWRVHHHRVCGATGTESCLYWPSGGLIWMRQCYWSSAWRSIHFPCYMALMLLCQPTYWWCFRSCDSPLFPGPRSFKARQSLVERENPSDGSSGHFHHHGSDCLLPACTPMGWCDKSLERFIRHRDTCRLFLTTDSVWSCRVVHG